MSIASVTVEHIAFSDPRLMYLAQLAGYADGIDTALGKMARLWGRCTYLHTDTPGDVEIRAILGQRGPELLVESGLGERLPDGSIRVRGRIADNGKDRHGWYREQTAQQASAGRARVRSARRDERGRLLPRSAGDSAGASGSPARTSGRASALDSAGASGASGASALEPAEPANIQRSPAPDPDPDLDLSLPRAREGAGGRVDLTTSNTPARDREALRRKLWNEAWTFAGLQYQQLGAEGIDRQARNCWGGIPAASNEASKALYARIDELLVGDTPDVEKAREALRNRVLVAAAEARRDRHRQYMTPMRMWDARSFAIAADLSPEQVANPPPKRAAAASARGSRADESAEPVVRGRFRDL